MRACRCECFGQYLVGEVSGAKPPVWQRTGQIILTWFPPLKKLRIIYIAAERLSVCTGVWKVRRKKAVSFMLMWWTKIAEQIRFAVGSKTCCVRCVILRVITLHLCHCFFVEPFLCTQMKTGSLQCYLEETIILYLQRHFIHITNPEIFRSNFKIKIHFRAARLWAKLLSPLF